MQETDGPDNTQSVENMRKDIETKWQVIILHCTWSENFIDGIDTFILDFVKKKANFAGEWEWPNSQEVSCV